MKYKKIYNILKKGGASITLDYSGWWSAYCPNNYMARNRPLWIVAEVPHLHLRLWITHEFGTLRVTTADTAQPSDSRAYGQPPALTWRETDNEAYFNHISHEPGR